MPYYIDIHDLAGGTVDDIARAHSADEKIQGMYGVAYTKYWVDESRGKVFCFCNAPSAEAARTVHEQAHGMVAQRIIEVDPDLVEGFLGGGLVSPAGAVLTGKTGERDPGLRTILFTDIVGSTAMTQRLGDKAAMLLLHVHDAVVRTSLVELNGREVKHLGDGIMAAFLSAAQAVRCAARIHQGMAARMSEHPDEPFQIRIGLASGQPVERFGDFFGSTVQLAARLCAKAQPGQTLVSSGVPELCADKGLAFEEVGELELKGFDRPVRAFKPIG
jgi:class 3 adenylate cyclase